MLTRPIPLRHPFIFYVGHLPAFAWNHVCRGAVGRASFEPSFDAVFDRGIDPDVDDPTKVHAHPEVPGGYDHRGVWAESDWTWTRRAKLAHPVGWVRSGGMWLYRTLFDLVPLARVADWPVSVSLAEARAYARWSGARLPTEAEFHRAAYGRPDGAEQAYPWGDEEPTSRHGNFHFVSWSPEPVGSRPDGASAWGT